MKNSKLSFLVLFISFAGNTLSFAQPRTKIVAGQISLDGLIKPDEKNYTIYIDSLDKNIITHPDDTSSLFYKALLIEQFNNQLAKSSPGAKGALDNLIIADKLVEQAVALTMKDFRLKVLQAQIYKDLTYRLAGDEQWKFTATEITDRKRQFNNYKELANKYYEELAVLDSRDAYDYRKLKVKVNYPLR